MPDAGPPQSQEISIPITEGFMGLSGTKECHVKMEIPKSLYQIGEPISVKVCVDNSAVAKPLVKTKISIYLNVLLTSGGFAEEPIFV